MKKYLSQILLLKLILIFGCLSAYSQNASGSSGGGLIKTGDGFLLVTNRTPISFTLEFKGESIKPLEADHPVFVLDGKLLQVVDLEFSNFQKAEKNAKKLTDDEYLELHKKWESDYIGNSLKQTLLVKSETIEILNKQKAMVWSFEMPKELNSDFSHQIFVTTVVGDRVVAINASVEIGKTLSDYKNNLIDIIKTLKTSDKPLDVNKIAQEIKNKAK